MEEIRKYDKKGVEIAEQLKLPITEHLLFHEHKVKQLVKVFTELKCKIVLTTMSKNNPYGFVIEMES